MTVYQKYTYNVFVVNYKLNSILYFIKKRWGYINTLKQTRKEQNLTVKFISEKVGITRSYYYQIERGEKEPSLHVAITLSKILNTKIEELFANLFDD